ncbi:MAG: glycosyltransferase family 1 protein [Caldimicrobium sp.]
MENRDIWIIEECRNPSTDYYILPFLELSGYKNRIRILNSPPEEIIEGNLTLLFVRYVTIDWFQFVRKNFKKIKKLIYFMDDDLFDLSAWKGLPLRYVKKIFFNAYIWKKWLKSIGAVFFVSNNYLAQKYFYLDPVVLPPYPIFDIKYQNSFNDSRSLIIFYHGTASHKKEIYWLYDVAKKVIANTQKDIVFEFVGDDRIYKKFKPLEKVKVVHPMKWPVYKDFLLYRKRYIGLIPFIDANFNLARNYTKFFEIVASGAVGIYSQGSPYERLISHEKDGIILPNKKEIWVENIERLLNDEFFMLYLYRNSVTKLNSLKEITERIYKTITI